MTLIYSSDLVIKNHSLHLDSPNASANVTVCFKGLMALNSANVLKI